MVATAIIWTDAVMPLFIQVRTSRVFGFWTNGMGTRNSPSTSESFASETASVQTTHVLVNASLYDGPPEQHADLVPEPAGKVDRWNLEGVDPYLLCHYKSTTKTIVLHAKASKVCEAGKRPFRAYCK